MKHREPPSYKFPSGFVNFSHPWKTAPTTVVLHSTEGATAESSIDYLRDKQFSYHYIIERDGTLFRLVDPRKGTAWHCGMSHGPDGDFVNSYSIGVCFACLDDGHDGFTDEAVETANWLIERLKDIFPALKWITTHKAIAPARKTDPAHLDLSRIDPQGLKWWPKKD